MVCGKVRDAMVVTFAMSLIAIAVPRVKKRRKLGAPADTAYHLTGVVEQHRIGKVFLVPLLGTYEIPHRRDIRNISLYRRPKSRNLNASMPTGERRER
jgi:hypothetical protein